MRFRVHVNGEHVCDAGLVTDGSVQVNLWHQSDKSYVPESHFEASGSPFANLGVFAFVHKADSSEVSQLVWTSKSLTAGDRVTIELVPPGDISPTENVIDDIKTETFESWYRVGEPVVVFDPFGWLVRLFKKTPSRK